MGYQSDRILPLSTGELVTFNKKLKPEFSQVFLCASESVFFDFDKIGPNMEPIFISDRVLEYFKI